MSPANVPFKGAWPDLVELLKNMAAVSLGKMGWLAKTLWALFRSGICRRGDHLRYKGEINEL
jgi:hypothetical protein